MQTLNLTREQVNALLILQNIHAGQTFQIIAWYTSKTRGLQLQGDWFTDRKRIGESIYQWHEDTLTWVSH